MIEVTVKEAKGSFFDRAKIVAAMDRATAKALAKFGAFVRTRARTSMKRRKGISPPAGPPYAHTGLIKRFLYFSYDDSRRSVVIGPARLNSTVDPDALPALEYGGESHIEDRRGKRRTITVKPRPFMGPAFKAELPNAPPLWRDSVR